MRESQIEAKLGKAIKSHGGLYYKFVSPGNSGVPDRIIILPGGKVIFVELKAKAGKLSALQQNQITRLRDKGADVRLIRGWEEAQVFIKEVMPFEVHSTRIPAICD